MGQKKDKKQQMARAAARAQQKLERQRKRKCPKIPWRLVLVVSIIAVITTYLWPEPLPPRQALVAEMQHYHQYKNPDRIIGLVREMHEEGMMDDEKFKDTFFGFLSGVMCEPGNEEYVTVWMTALQPPRDFGESWNKMTFVQRNWVLKSLQMCHSPAVRALKQEIYDALYKQYETTPDQETQTLLWLFDEQHNPPTKLLESAPSIETVDAVWGRYYATGDPIYAEFIFTLVDVPVGRLHSVIGHDDTLIEVFEYAQLSVLTHSTTSPHIEKLRGAYIKKQYKDQKVIPKTYLTEPKALLQEMEEYVKQAKKTGEDIFDDL